MARGWKCPRCSTENSEGTMNCSKCGLIQGGVVVPSSYSSPDPVPPAAQGVEPGTWWKAETAPTPTGAEDTAPATWNVGAAPVDPAQAPPSRIPLWRRLPLRLIVFLVLVGGGALAGVVFNASRSETGEIVKEGDLTVNDLRIGDCFDLKDPAADEVADVTALPCKQEHEYELIFVGAMSDGTYPTDGAIDAFAQDQCVPAFDAYVGKAYADSELAFLWFFPLPDGWDDGDHAVQCAAYHPRIHRLTESLKGSAR